MTVRAAFYDSANEDRLGTVLLAEAPVVGDLVGLPDYPSDVWEVERRCWSVGYRANAHGGVGAPEPANHLQVLVRRSEGMFRH